MKYNEFMYNLPQEVAKRTHIVRGALGSAYLEEVELAEGEMDQQLGGSKIWSMK